MRLYLPNATLTSRLTGATQNIENQLKEVAGDVASGRRSDQVGFLKGEVGRAMLAQNAVEKLDFEGDQIALRLSRLSATQQSLNSVADAPGGIALDVQAAVGMGDDRKLALSADAAEVALDHVFKSLNTRHGERHLFSGDATATPPLGSVDELMLDLRGLAQDAATPAEFEAAVSDYFNSPDGGWQSGIYRGTPTASSPDSVVAVDPAVTELVSGLAVIALAGQTGWGDGSPISEEGLYDAADRVSNGGSKLTDLRAQIGMVEAELEQRSEALDARKTLATQTLNDLTARDPYEAAVELQQLETNLETAYALTARLAELSLLRFLR